MWLHSNITLTDLKFVEKRFLLIQWNLEAPPIKIMFLGKGFASLLWALFSNINGFAKFVPLHLPGKLMFSSTLVSDVKWFHEADTLLDLYCYWIYPFCFGNFLYLGEINLTFLNSPEPLEGSIMVHICSLIFSYFFLWEKNLEGELGCVKEIPCCFVRGNNSMLSLCISFLFPNSGNI